MVLVPSLSLSDYHQNSLIELILGQTSEKHCGAI